MLLEILNMLSYNCTSSPRYGESLHQKYDSSISSYYSDQKQSATKQFGTHFPNFQNSKHERYILLDGSKMGLNINRPLFCKLSIKGNHTILFNKKLGITSVGEDIVEAISEFSNEVNYLYFRLNEFNDDQLTRKLLKKKYILNELLKT